MPDRSIRPAILIYDKKKMKQSTDDNWEIEIWGDLQSALIEVLVLEFNDTQEHLEHLKNNSELYANTPWID